LAAIPSKQPASIEHRASTQQTSSIEQASSKQPATKSLSESGFIPAQKNAALLAKTSDGPPTL